MYNSSHKKTAGFRIISLLLAALICTGAFCGCADGALPTGGDNVESTVVTEPPEPVTITVSGSWPDCRAIDTTAAAFNELYPNCTVVYEYLQDYSSSLEKRLTGDEQVDIFMTMNIQSSSPYLPYALDIAASGNIDLSQTFDGLIENFMYKEEDGTRTKLYAVPVGAEMRGLYINTTLLTSLGLSVPTDQKSLLECCAVLKENGYIPFHGNPAAFAQQLVYPWIANNIANAADYTAAFNAVDSRSLSALDYLDEPMRFIYSLVENGYYDYKYAQDNLGLFNSNTDDDYARYFLSIVKSGDDYVKSDDVGRIAFMPGAMSLKGTIDKMWEDYHSEIDYVFVPAPVGENGGYAYLSPAHGIAINKNSASLEWAEKFIDFMFKPDNNKTFAQLFNVIPNTKEAFSYIRTLYKLPDKNMSHLGQVTFNYGFYALVVPVLTDISKCNNPRYMTADDAGNTVMYTYEHFKEIMTQALELK